MAEVSEVIAALDKKILAATAMHDKIKAQLDKEQIFANWLEKCSSYFYKCLSNVKQLDAQMKCFLTSATEWGETHVISDDLRNTMDRIVELNKQLDDLTAKHMNFYEASGIEADRKAYVGQFFAENCLRLQQIKWVRSQMTRTEEELGNIEVPDFLWAFNNLIPLHDPQSIMDEYNCGDYVATVQQIANEFKAITKYFCKKTHGPENNDGGNDGTCSAEHNDE